MYSKLTHRIQLVVTMWHIHIPKKSKNYSVP